MSWHGSIRGSESRPTSREANSCQDQQPVLRRSRDASPAVNGRLAFHGERIVLTLADAPENTTGSNSSSSRQAEAALSRKFAGAAIEPVGAVREWVTARAVMIKNGYAVLSTSTVFTASHNCEEQCDCNIC